MGTRGLTIIQFDGEYKVAQYGQWDHYPRGQGAIALRFMRKLMATKTGLKKFTEKVRQCSWLTEEGRDRINAEFKIPKDQQWISMEVAERRAARYPEISRNTGADILELIYKREEPVKLDNEIEFAKEGLFCEWAYVVDLDKKTFEVYEGFKEKPTAKQERFCGTEIIAPEKPGEDVYYPVQLVKKYSLKKLPTVKQMISECTPEDEQE